MSALCRLCLSSSTNYQDVHNIEPKWFEVVLTNIDVYKFEPSVICNSCIDALREAHSFKVKCSETETAINDYLKDHIVTDLDNFNLHDVLLYKNQSFRNQMYIDKKVKEIKQEIEETEYSVEVEQIAYFADAKTNLLGCNDEKVHKEMAKHRFQCDICLESYPDKKGLLFHIRSHFEKPCCRICQESFADVLSSKQHIITVHGIQINLLKKSSEDHKEFDEIEFEVDELQLMATVLAHLEKYKTLNENDTSNTSLCEICCERFNRGDFCNHLKLHFCRPKCTICSKAFYNWFSLKRHLTASHSMKLEDISNKETNSSTENFCEYCLKRFTSKYTLKEHVQNVHLSSAKILDSIEPIFTCGHCYISFGEKTTLTTHIKEIHIGQKSELKYICTCGKRFKFQSQMKYHSEKHKPVREMYSCDVCGNNYMSKNTLQTHRSRHFMEKRFKCGICGLRSHRRCNIRLHLERVHLIPEVELNNSLLLLEL